MNNVALALSAAKRGLRPDPYLMLSDWADEYRKLPAKGSAEPGQWRTSRTPYLKEILDCLSPQDPCKEICFIKPTQIGGTEIGLNWFGYTVHIAPGPMMMVQPTVDLGKRLVKQRLNTTILETPVLNERINENKSRDTSNTMLYKDFEGGVVLITGANSAVGLRSMPVKLLYLDEIDGYPLDVDGEGDPCKLAEKRTSNFPDKKVLKTSTPLDKSTSRIMAAYELSDQRQYHVPCPHCKEPQTLKWGQIKFERDEQYHLVGYPHYICEYNGCIIEEDSKTFMLKNGRWIADNPKSNKPGFWINGLYTPLGWRSWGEITQDFLDAKKTNDLALLKTWTNTDMAEVWDDEQGTEVDQHELMARCEPYKEQLPKDVLVVTCGVDVQDDRLEAEVLGHGLSNETWSIEYVVFDGDPDKPQVWDELDTFLKSKYKHVLGFSLGIAATCIDTGGHNTGAVYNFTKRREHRRIYAIKGSNIWGAPPTKSPSKKSKAKEKLWMLGVNGIKEAILHRLGIMDPGPGYCHFPESYKDNSKFFNGITAEKIVKRYKKGFEVREFKKFRERNEPLDCRCYATGAFLIINPKLNAIKQEFERRVEAGIEEKPKEKSKKRPQKKKSWVNSW